MKKYLVKRTTRYEIDFYLRYSLSYPSLILIFFQFNYKVFYQTILENSSLCREEERRREEVEFW